MTEVEVEAPEPLVASLRDAALLVCGHFGVERATMAVMVVTPEHMAEVNAEHRGKPTPTDVLSFPVDGPVVRDGWPGDGPPAELGDVLICPEAATDPLPTLAIHGTLHLLGFDHETDDGEMLDLQDQLVARLEARA